MQLWDHQKKALSLLHNGSVLVGGTGSGKSTTALAYYLKLLATLKEPPERLYIITTAKKRDDLDWVREARRIGITEPLTIDSWNNIKKYIKITNSFFIFDEQRVVGYGVWTKSFLKITNKNRWILLSATPADSWIDLVPVFIANGFYRNKTEFNMEHVIFAPRVKYPKIIGYRNELKLERQKQMIFVVMSVERKTKQHIIKIPVGYNETLVNDISKRQWDPYREQPIATLTEEIFIIRRVINSHPSRVFALLKIHEQVKKLIIFYNFNFELDILKLWFEFRTIVAEYNGHKHDPIPTANEWVYLVQYISGSEAWECFETNHMAFYSLGYSYRQRIQARGRIDRHNTHFTDLYYYELVSDSFLDKAIEKAFMLKKDFNLNMLPDRRESHVV